MADLILPGGLSVALDASGNWEKVILATGPGSANELAICAPGEALRDALMVNDGVVVIANATPLGPAVCGCGGTPGFSNVLTLSGWRFQICPGVKQCLMISKSKKGALWTPDGVGLLSDPSQWTQAAVFSAAEPASIAALVGRIDSVFRDAHSKRTDPYHAHFNDVATNPDWTGILILSPSILSAGCAHHLGVTLSTIDPAASGASVSSIFGYIDDVDGPGGFRVLFQNSAVQAFDFVPADMVSASP